MTRFIQHLILVPSIMVFIFSANAENIGIATRDGNHFTLNGNPFYYAGANNYYQMVYAADMGLRYAVDEVIEEIAAMDMSVLRTWAFNDGVTQWNSLQTSPGIYQEYVFQGLDYVLHKADLEGIRLILPFINNWDDYGGMNQYVDWADSAYTLGTSGFVEVNGTHFEIGGRKYYYVGANYWYGLNLASNGSGGDRDRLNRELDSLKAIGITNLRIMTGSEGPDTEPWRMVPSFQTSPGVYDPDVLDGLDYLIYAMKQRGIRAVMCLNNFWQWSGGMAQYVNWNGGGPIPYPPPEPGGSWDAFQDYASDFYSNAGAMQDFEDHIAFIINRTNPYTSTTYSDEPAIMSWELCNEPRGFNNNAAAFNIWIDNCAAYIKSLDSNHLVTTGCEGDTPWPSWNGLDFIQNHNGPDIDYTTIHIWPQNWGWYDPANPGGTYASSEASAITYFNNHEAEAVSLGKPMVLEEFGLARDSESYDPSSSTTWRNTFFNAMFDEVYTSASSGQPAAGTNIWSWAGEGRPVLPYGSYWSIGDPWIGDPPHEHQGWYSVYDSDVSTIAIISSHSDQMKTLLTSGEHDDFYQDELCIEWYENHVNTVLNRVNVFNGRVYKEDPTVFAWELANEPECTSDAGGDILQTWIEETAVYIKSIDSLHMVTTGSEGFYGPTGPAHNPSGWMESKGVDFIRNHQPEAIDFACYHAWPDWWGMNLTTSINWTNDHIADTDALLGKPLILEEYGKSQPISTRNQYFQSWLDVILAGAQAGNSSAGSNLWILYHDDYPDYDGFGVYYPAHTSTISILEAHADSMNLLNSISVYVEHVFSSGWHMMSIPLIPEYANIDSIFGDDITGAYYVYEYSQIYGYELIDEVEHGAGYWLALENGAAVDLTGTVPGDSTLLPLDLNWNIVGAAYSDPILLQSLHFTNGIITQSFNDAVNSGWISPAVYQYNNSMGSYQSSDSLHSWGGYWLQTLSSGLQMLTYSPVSEKIPLPMIADNSDEEDDWFVQIEVTLGNLSDYLPGIGVHYNATDEYDVWYDMSAPPTPPSGDYIRLVFYHPEWLAPVGDIFSTDTRAPLDSSSVKTWEGIIEASEEGMVTVDFDNILSILPAGYSARVEHFGGTVDLLQTPQFTFNYTDPYVIDIIVSNDIQAIDDLTLSLSDLDVLLDWSDMAGASVYYIYRSTDPYFETTGISPIDSTAVSQYLDLYALLNVVYFYRVTWE